MFIIFLPLPSHLYYITYSFIATFSLGKKGSCLWVDEVLKSDFPSTCLHECYLTEIVDEFSLDSSVLYIYLPWEIFAGPISQGDTL